MNILKKSNKFNCLKVPEYITDIQALESHLMTREYTKEKLVNIINDNFYKIDDIKKKMNDSKSSLISEILFMINDELGNPFQVVDRRKNSLLSKKMHNKKKINEITIETANRILKEKLIKVLYNRIDVNYLLEALNHVNDILNGNYKSDLNDPIGTVIELIARRILK